MGDVVSLVEKAAEAITEEDARRMEEKMRTASFDLNDFLRNSSCSAAWDRWKMCLACFREWIN